MEGTVNTAEEADGVTGFLTPSQFTLFTWGNGL
jgi:hypothetical protein